MNITDPDAGYPLRAVLRIIGPVTAVIAGIGLLDWAVITGIH